MNVLLDSGPLVALCDPRDGRHRTAMRHLETLAQARFSTCESVLSEACFHLRHPAQRRRLEALLAEWPVDPSPLAADVDFWPAVFEWLTKYADHGPDWTDGCLAVLCSRDESLRVWTYDREFRGIWRTAAGRTIPLAVEWR